MLGLAPAILGLDCGVPLTAPTGTTLQIAADPLFLRGSRNVTVTNPDGQSGTLTNGFTVTR